MIMRKLFFLLVLILFSHSIYSQINLPLQFNETQYNFGVVKEETEKITHTFKFKNISKDAVVISNVSTACGCTAGEWTKIPIGQSEEGSIVVTYTTSSRAGKFSQPVVVYLNKDTIGSIKLIVYGEVLPRAKTKFDYYPIPVGNLRFKTTHVAFDKIYNDIVSFDTLFIYNNWDKPMSVVLKDLPDFITCEVVPKVLKPKKEGLVIIRYDATKRNDLGLIFDRLTLLTNDSIENAKTFHVSAEIMENFSHLNLNDLKNAPEMVFEFETSDFDSITEGEVVRKVYKFKNAGINDLIIRKISTSCGCTASNISSKVIRSNQEGSITVDFNSAHKKGYQRQTITVITNNPHKPTIKLVLQGYVKPKKLITND